MVFLVLGTMLGAGILGLPTSAGLSGLAACITAQLLVASAMLFSAVIIINENVSARKNNFNYPSLYESCLGSKGKWLAVTANIIILYGLLIAYISGSTSVVSHLTGIPDNYQKPLMVAIYLVLSIMSMGGLELIKRYNSVLVFFLLGSFIVMLCLLFSRVNLSNLMKYNDFGFLPSVFPIIVSAFCFHTIIPSICSASRWHKKNIITAVIISLVFVFFLNTFWIGAVIGILPLEGDAGLDYAYRHGMPATIPLDNMIDSDLFTALSVSFALLAIITSFIGVSISLKDFLRDILENTFGYTSRSLNLIFTFIPPILISLLYPDIFLDAMNIVGGVGIVILFGILPAVIHIKKSATRLSAALGILMLLVFISFLLFEVCQETGLLKIDPECEYYHAEYGG